MPELRLNLLTREWVIIATERARRPSDFTHIYTERPALPPHLATCPFCFGNEKRTSDELYRHPNDSIWKIRVVANKFPALSREGEKKRIRDGFRRAVAGVGLHEVIIESPIHNATIPLLDSRHVEDIIRTYKMRFVEAYEDRRIEHAIIFKNRGERSGTSLDHPHSQLMATPVVPLQFRDRVQAAMHFFDDTGRCLICSILEKDREEGARIVLDTERFTTLIPYAALSPFHTWIFPKRHSATFADITDEEIAELSVHVKTLLQKFHSGLGDPDYNYVIRSSRPADTGNEYCHWYFSLIPHIAKTTGVELGTGIFINTTLPEESAGLLRSIKIE